MSQSNFEVFTCNRRKPGENARVGVLAPIGGVSGARFINQSQTERDTRLNTSPYHWLLLQTVGNLNFFQVEGSIGFAHWVCSSLLPKDSSKSNVMLKGQPVPTLSHLHPEYRKAILQSATALSKYTGKSLRCVSVVIKQCLCWFFDYEETCDLVEPRGVTKLWPRWNLKKYGKALKDRFFVSRRFYEFAKSFYDPLLLKRSTWRLDGPLCFVSCLNVWRLKNRFTQNFFSSP